MTRPVRRAMNGELDEVLNGRKSIEDAIDAFVAYGQRRSVALTPATPGRPDPPFRPVPTPYFR